MKKRKTQGKTDWEAVQVLSEAKLTQRAKEDKDAPLLNKKELMEFKRVHPVQTIDVKRIRKKVHLSQKEFAEYFGVKIRTVQEWEQGRRHPTSTAMNFLKVIEREPKAVQRALRHK